MTSQQQQQQMPHAMSSAASAGASVLPMSAVSALYNVRKDANKKVEHVDPNSDAFVRRARTIIEEMIISVSSLEETTAEVELVAPPNCHEAFINEM